MKKQNYEQWNLLWICHEVSEGFPFSPFPNLIFIFVQQNEAQRRNFLIFSAPFCVVSSAEIRKCFWRFYNRKLSFRSLPNVRAGSDLWFEKFFEIFEKFVFLWTALHCSNRNVRVTLRLFIFCAAAGNRLAGVFMYAPTVAGGTVALHSFIASIDRAFRKEKLILNKE